MIGIISYRPGWDCHGLPIELKALEQIRVRHIRNKLMRENLGIKKYIYRERETIYHQ